MAASESFIVNEVSEVTAFQSYRNAVMPRCNN